MRLADPLDWRQFMADAQARLAHDAGLEARGTLTRLTGLVLEASGIRAARAAEFDNPDAFVLSDGAGNDRFPVRAATDGGRVRAYCGCARVVARSGGGRRPVGRTAAARAPAQSNGVSERRS